MLLVKSSTRSERLASPSLRGAPLWKPARRTVLAHRRHRLRTFFGTRASFSPHRQAVRSLTSAQRSRPLCLRLALTSRSRLARMASSQVQPRRPHRIKPRPRRSATSRDSQTMQTPSPHFASGRSRRPSCCFLTRLLLSTSACSRSTLFRLLSSQLFSRVTNLNQLRSHPPRHTRYRTCSLSQPQLLCPNPPL